MIWEEYGQQLQRTQKESRNCKQSQERSKRGMGQCRKARYNRRIQNKKGGTTGDHKPSLGVERKGLKSPGYKVEIRGPQIANGSGEIWGAGGKGNISGPQKSIKFRGI